jgi:sialate O-acetylesterase
MCPVIDRSSRSAAVRSSRRRKHATCLLVCALALSRVAAAAPLLHAIFQDHAVVQRGKPIGLWGVAAPGETLSLSFAGATAQARADDAGRWSATLPALEAGGPHEISVRASSGPMQTIKDVLVGDVWLCSGQSNMVLQVHRALDSRAEIANSTNDRIRLLTIPSDSSPLPRTQFVKPVEWQSAGPASVAEFSAACLFFARELQKTVNVPMGLITAAWGGSKVQTWMSERALRAMGGNDEALDVLALYAERPAAAHARWGAMWESWWRERTHDRPGTEPWAIKPAGVWHKAPRALGFWEHWGVPQLANYNGMLWYRTKVSVSVQQAAQTATLSLGLVDEMDQTWINGRPVGAASKRSADAKADDRLPVTGPGPERTYRLARGTLNAGENVIVVSVVDTYATGGLAGPPEQRALRFADGSSVLLGDEWQYQIPPGTIGDAPRPPWEPVRGLGVIYNAMVAPLANLAMRGIVWYQGESNTSEAARYQELLTRFISDWRERFGADLPFLIVQLANYGPAPTAPAESGWAEVREAQRLVVAKDAHAGLAVAIDIGDRYDIHPANKQEVGRRLARAARRAVYGEQIAPSGPIPLSAHRKGANVVISFGDVAERLVAYSAEGPIGFELCTRAASSCRYASARIEGDRVLLDASNFAAPSRVRYCWADSPMCTLFDIARLPAGPFQIEVQ